MRYKIDGIVRVANQPVSRTLRLYNRETGLMVGKTTSGEDGHYTFRGLKTNAKIQVVCLGSDDYDDLIHASIPVIDEEDAPTLSPPSNDMILDGIKLPEVLVWKDEFDWSSVKHDIKYAATGGIIVQEHLKIGGRPITLENELFVAYIDNATKVNLFNKQQQAGLVMNLSINSTTMQVIFRQNDQPLIIKKTNQDDNTLYILESIKLMQVFNN